LPEKTPRRTATPPTRRTSLHACRKTSNHPPRQPRSRRRTSATANSGPARTIGAQQAPPAAHACAAGRYPPLLAVPPFDTVTDWHLLAEHERRRQAALQSLVDPEEYLELEGLSDSDWRERIGNTVPPDAPRMGARPARSVRRWPRAVPVQAAR